MIDRRSLGTAGEKVAVSILEKEGYRVLRTNFATRFGEIDIVADEAGCLCFVEVKLRSSALYGSAVESLTYRKRRHLRKAAEIFLYTNGSQERECRFDLLALDWDRGASRLRGHVLIRNAFGADE